MIRQGSCEIVMGREGRVDSASFRTFLAIARTGSFTAAAAELGLTQPGVSRQLQRLERAVGVPLVDRGGRSIRMTVAGERFRAYAEAAVEREQAILDELRGAGAVLVGALQIAASSTPGEFVVPSLVAAFVERHPRVRPEVLVADSAVVEDEVRAHRWDVGFVGARLNRRGLHYHDVVADEVVLAVPIAHPFAARGEIALAELAGQPFLAREGGSGTGASVERVLTERGLRLPAHRTVMVLGSTQAIVSAVERGLGLGWVSSLALADRRPDRVAAVRLAGMPVRRVLSLVRDPLRALPPTAAAFVAWVERHRPTAETEPVGFVARLPRRDGPSA